MVERLLGWLSGDTEQMPRDSGVFPKDVRVEACVLLGLLRSSGHAATVHEALLETMRHCTVRPESLYFLCRASLAYCVINCPRVPSTDGP